jgi:hypothetical protein
LIEVAGAGTVEQILRRSPRVLIRRDTTKQPSQYSFDIPVEYCERLIKSDARDCSRRISSNSRKLAQLFRTCWKYAIVLASDLHGRCVQITCAMIVAKPAPLG